MLFRSSGLNKLNKYHRNFERFVLAGGGDILISFVARSPAGWLAGNPCVRACEPEYVTGKPMVSEKENEAAVS